MKVSVDGPKLRDIRLSKSLTTEELAKQAGVSVRTLIEIEGGVRQAREATILAISKALGIAWTDVFAAPAIPAPASGGPSGPEPEGGDAGADPPPA